MSPNGRRYGFSVGLQLLAVLALALVAVLARDVFLLGFAALMIATVLRYLIDWLARRMHRTAAVVITLVFVGLVIFMLSLVAVPALGEQLAQLWEQLPGAMGQLERWIARSPDVRVLIGAPERAPTHDVHERLMQEASALAAKAFPAAFTVVEAVSGLLFVFVLAAFVASNPAAYRTGLLLLVPREHEELVSTALRRADAALRRWMAGILISMVIMGCLTGVGLLLAGVQAWFTLALLTLFGTFVPYLGALASAVPGLAVALAESPRRFFYALIVYVLVHIVEGYFVEPLVMKRAVSLKPGVLIFWQLIMATLFGVLGLVVATPLLACVKELVELGYVERRLGKSDPDPLPESRGHS